MISDCPSSPMDHSSSPWSGFLCQTTHGVLCPAARNSCSSAMFPQACGHPSSTQDPPCLLDPQAGQGADLGVLSASHMCCCPRWAEQAHRAISAAFLDINHRLLPLLKRKVLVMGIGIHRNAALSVRSVTSGKVEGLKEQIHVFCCLKEKGFREGEKISKLLTSFTVIIHFCPLAAIGSLLQLQSYLPGYSSATQ